MLLYPTDADGAENEGRMKVKKPPKVDAKSVL